MSIHGRIYEMGVCRDFEKIQRRGIIVVVVGIVMVNNIVVVVVVVIVIVVVLIKRVNRNATME